MVVRPFSTFLELGRFWFCPFTIWTVFSGLCGYGQCKGLLKIYYRAKFGEVLISLYSVHSVNLFDFNGDLSVKCHKSFFSYLFKVNFACFVTIQISGFQFGYVVRREVFIFEMPRHVLNG